MHDEEGKRRGVGVMVSMGCTVLASTLACGCDTEVTERGDVEKVGAASAAIVGGSAADIPAMGTLVGSLYGSSFMEKHCTATLIASDVLLTAAHCVVREGVVENSPVCSPWLNQWLEFVASDGSRYAVDLDNLRVYVPGQSFEQLTSLELNEHVGVGLCAGGAVNVDYYVLHPWEDVAVIGILPDVDGSLPTADPVALWNVSSAEVEAALGGWFEWAGNAMPSPLKFEAQGGMQYSATPGPLCGLPNLTISAPANQQFFFTDIECQQGVYSGLLEGGDSGGPLFVELGGQKLLAGVGSSFVAKDGSSGSCPSRNDVCDPGDVQLNIWASVPNQLGFISQALEWAANDHDADGVPNEDDNCPLHPNATQANANRDYEVAVVGYEQQGDACDPSPVAEALAGDAISATSAEWYANCTPDESTSLEDCVLRREAHELELWTVWSSEQPNEAESAATGFRYCICRDADGNPIGDKARCRDERGCLVDNLQFTLSEGTGANETRWLRIAARKNGTYWRNNGEVVAYSPGRELARSLYWEWESDAPRWKDAGFWLDPVSPPSGPTGPFIAGLMWGHNNSVAGSDEHLEQAPGTCEAVGAECGFGNSYSFWVPWALSYSCPMFPPNWPREPIEGTATTSAEPAAAAEQRFVPEPSRVLGIPLVSASAGLAELPFETHRLADVRVEPGFAVPCESADGLSIAELALPSGAFRGARVMDDAFSPELRDLLLARDDLMWLWPSEPVELGGPRAGPLAVAIDRATGSPAAFMAPDGQGGLRSTLRPRGTMPAALAGVPTVLGPTTYSRLRRELVQLRGTDAAEPLDLVATVSLDGSSTEHGLEPASLRPMAAVAAAYNPSAMRLWMVGCRGSADCSDKPLELFVIDVATGHIERVRAFLPSLRRFWLASSGKGEMALVAAPEQAASHLVAIFEADELGVASSARLTGVDVRAGRVVGPARTTADVLLVPASKPQAKTHPEQPSLYYVDAVPLAEVRGRMRGACFAGPDEP